MKRRIVNAVICLLTAVVINAQVPDWQHKDLEKDSIFGISTDRVYTELLTNKKKFKPVLVAVIDSGTDSTHEDLKPILWINPKEKTNGKDDDRDGYTDDLRGWNFIGGRNGNVLQDNLELTRIIRRDQHYYDSLAKAGVPAPLQEKYQAYLRMKKLFDQKYREASSNAKGYGEFLQTIDSIILKTGKENPGATDIDAFLPVTDAEKRAKGVILQQLQHDPDLRNFRKAVAGTLDYFKTQADYQLNLEFDPRNIVGDDYENASQRQYGNNDSYGPRADHGTHVAGIIGAVRNNSIGMNGIADHVSILAIRAIPDGDERDKDVANAIRYAVDRGAKVINMSFGKGYSYNKEAVDEAVRYAVKKDVLLIHAAGNEGLDLDKPANENFPNRFYADSSGEAATWIEVGASGMKNDSTLAAGFSNYGKNRVDVFAPGVQIFSCTPGSQYEYFDGTSMAAPVVAGLAALIREYYPKLSAVQVKKIILESVVKVDHPVIVKDGMRNKKVPFSEICRSGGVVNAYRALRMAARFR